MAGGFVTPLLLSLALSQTPDVRDGALDPDRLRESAAAHFHQGVAAREADPEQARASFLQAAIDYEFLRLWEAHNPLLYRNQGSAYLLSDHLPEAILAYRRGLRLDPTDRTLRQALGHARGRVVHSHPGPLGLPPLDHRPPWLPRLDTDGNLIVLTGLYSLGWVVLTRWRMTRRRRLLGVGAASFALAALLGLGFALDLRYDQEQDRYPLVVIADDGVLLRKGNGLAYPPRYETPLNRGVEARLLFARGCWLQIEFAGGEVGWVPGQYARIDTPDSDTPPEGRPLLSRLRGR